jgi:hypothetical protein
MAVGSPRRRSRRRERSTGRESRIALSRSPVRDPNASSAICWDWNPGPDRVGGKTRVVRSGPGTDYELPTGEPLKLNSRRRYRRRRGRQPDRPSRSLTTESEAVAGMGLRHRKAFLSCCSLSATLPQRTKVGLARMNRPTFSTRVGSGAWSQRVPVSQMRRDGVLVNEN